MKFINRLRIPLFLIGLSLIFGCAKKDTPTQIPIQKIEENIKFTITPDNSNGNISVTSDTLTLTINISSKVPDAGVKYSLEMIQVDNGLSIMKTEKSTTDNSFKINVFPFQIEKSYSIKVTAISNTTISNTLSINLNAERKWIYKNYLKPSYDLQMTDVKIDISALRKKFGGKQGQELAICFLDINGDGHDDIFVNPVCGTSPTEKTQGEIYIYKNGDYYLDNSYFNVGQIPSLVHARKALVGDYNGDGKPDIFLTGHGWDQPPFPGEYTQLLLSENGKYTLKEFKEKIGFYHGACSGDIDNDGDLDIFVLDGNNSYFLINDGKGNFTYSFNKIDGNSLYNQYHCELVDIDKDGYLDLIMGGHEFMVTDPTFSDINGIKGSTRIYWGNANHVFDANNMTNIPVVDNWGVITDLDVVDLDGDNKNELLITRTGGKLINNVTTYFYNGWYIQTVKIENHKTSDITSSIISNNSCSLGYQRYSPWILWMRAEDYDGNGKIDFFNTKCNGNPFVRWELQNGKLVRIN